MPDTDALACMLEQKQSPILEIVTLELCFCNCCVWNYWRMMAIDPSCMFLFFLKESCCCRTYLDESGKINHNVTNSTPSPRM